MTCTECGKELNGGTVFSVPTCRSCAIRITVKEFFLKVMLSVLIAYILYWIAGRVFAGSSNELLFTIMLIGFPFGAKRMFTWVIPFGGNSVAASIGILLMNVVVGAFIGWVVLAWTVLSGIVKIIYRFIRIMVFRPLQIT